MARDAGVTVPFQDDEFVNCDLGTGRFPRRGEVPQGGVPTRSREERFTRPSGP